MKIQAFGGATVLDKYPAGRVQKKGTITQVTVLRPTPKGKTLQDVYDLTVSKGTKFYVPNGDEKTELNSKTVLTDDATKEMMTQKPGSTLGDNAGLPVEVEVKGKAVTSITFKPKKKKD